VAVVNYTEIAVGNVLKELFDSYKGFNNFCDCEICRSRAAAIALNELKPHYVYSDAEYMAAKARFQSPSGNATLVAIVMDAIRKVLANPDHDIPPLTLHKKYI